MATVKVEKNSYTVEPLYQWDKDQTLEIYGLSLASIPEVHFANAAMGRAIVRQASMDAAGVVRVEVPNSMLQKPYTIQVYVCTYAGSTFETQYKLELPVKARTQPADYTLEDDPEVYSFNALENQVVNALEACRVADEKYNAAVAAQKEAKAAYENAKSDVDGAVDAAVDTAMEGIMPTLLSDTTRTKFGLGTDAVPDDVFSWIGNYNQHWWSALYDQGGTAYREVKTDITSQVNITVGYGVPSQTIGYSREITIDQSTGAIALKNPQQMVLNGSYNSESATFAALESLCAMSPVYITNLYANTSAIYCLPVGSTFAFNSSTATVRGGNTGDGFFFWLAIDGTAVMAQLVTSQAYTIPPGDKVYIHSDDRNAYPDNGEADGVLYQYLGVPFEKMPTVPRIATGSYTGTNTFGEANANSLTFDFAPKYLKIFSRLDTNGRVYEVQAASNMDYFVNEFALDSLKADVYVPMCGNNYQYAKKSADGKTITWYGTSQQYQMNYSCPYYYIAIG